MDLKHNFGAGPAKLPPAVLETARRELMDYQGTGISVMEMSHRSKEFQAIASKCEQDLREILSIGDDYAVLFMQGGATTQFSCVPLNINRPDISPRAAYIDTGFWSDRAIVEAKRLTQVDVIAESRSQSYRSVPQNLDAKLKEARDTLADSQYLHFTDNETIHGIEFPPAYDFQNGDCPLVSDMSSNIMSRRLDVSRYGLIYAGAQKNMGPSGLTIVIVRKDLIGLTRSQGPIPYLLDYKVLADNDSMANTPPTFAWYLCGLVCKWVKDQGGLEAIEAMNAEKARILYEAIDESRVFANPVDPAYRSRMNVPFVIKQADPDKKLEKSFLALADKQGFIGLAGHRAVGGMRASLYNAVDLDSTKALCQLIKQFDRDFS